MKATKKLALVCAALAAATFGFVSCSSDDDSDYDDNATAVALIRQPTSWKATGNTTTTETVDAVAGTTKTEVSETDYSTGNKTVTTTVVAKDGTTTTTVYTYDRSTGKYTYKIGDDSGSGEADAVKYTSYDHSDVLAFAFNGTYTETYTQNYVTGAKKTYTSSSTEKGSFSGYPTLANQTITLSPTSSESSSSKEQTVSSVTSSSSTSSNADSVKTKVGKVSSDRKTLTVTTTTTSTSKSTTGTTTDTNTTTTKTIVTTYAKQ